MKIYTSPASFNATFTANSPFVGFEAANIENTAINIYAASEDRDLSTIRMDMAAPTQVHCLHFHHVNFQESAVTIYLGRTLLDFDTMNTNIIGQTDNYGRSWITAYPFANGFTDDYQYVWIEIAASAQTLDGQNYYYIGSGYIFRITENLGQNPAWGMTMEHVYPAVSEVLANGARATARVGPEYDIIEMRWQSVRSRAQYPEFYILQGLRSGPIFVDLEYSTHPWLMWPMIADEPGTETTFQSSDLDEIRFNLRELVTL